MRSELEDVWVDVLASIYRSVDWRKIRRSPYDVFEHRVEFAKYERDVPSVIQKLCDSLSLQAPPIPLDKVEKLRENEEEAMKVLRKMPKLLSIMAATKAREKG